MRLRIVRRIIPCCHTIYLPRRVNHVITQITQSYFMKHADRPFIGILIVSIAILYGVIAMLS